jgi:penicillin V acylase-like amidase (Ntn superfamily)
VCAWPQRSLHVLNNFDIPKDFTRANDQEDHDNFDADSTIRTSAIDLTKQISYFRSNNDSRVRSVLLADFPVAGRKMVILPSGSREQIQPLKP